MALAQRPPPISRRVPSAQAGGFLGAALVERDGATFERLLAPGFVYTENDRLMTRDDVI